MKDENSQNSLVSQHPRFAQSSIKKRFIKNRFYNEIQRDTPENISCNASPISCYKNPFDEIQQDIDGPNSINFQNEEGDQQIVKQIQLLNLTISQKLNEQFELLKLKIKQKQKKKQDILKQYRKTITYDHFNQMNFEKNNTKNKQKQNLNKNNPLDTKKIKNKIVRPIQNVQNIELSQLKAETPASCQSQPIFKSENLVQSLNEQKQHSFPKTHVFNKLTGHLQTISHSETYNIDLIKQMGQELKRIQFSRIQQMAQGKFNFPKRK